MVLSDLSGQQLGQYDLITDLGAGTYSRTYLAFQPRLRRHVAVKILLIDPENPTQFLQRFEQIAQAAAQLNHPNIVPSYDFGEERGLGYLVMQSVTGGTFKTRLGKPLAVSEAVSPIIQLARALHHAHQRGVLHLNVSPTNILIDQENTNHLLLTDFSLSQLYQSLHLTRTGLPLGEPAYLAPEQIEDEQTDARTDVYSLGALLFEALAGQPPFTGASPVIILNKHLHELPPYIRGFNPAVPRELAHIVARAMSRRPEDRYPSAEAFALALEPYQDSKARHYRITLSLEDLNLPDDDLEPVNQPPRSNPPAQEQPKSVGPAHAQDGQNHVSKAVLTQKPLAASWFKRATEGATRGQSAHADKAQRQLKAEIQEISAILYAQPHADHAISLVPALGATLLRQVRRLAGHGHAGRRVERWANNPLAQTTTGIASIALTLVLALSLTLLAVVQPGGDAVSQAPGGLIVNNPTPTATLVPSPTATLTPVPTATATPSGPAVDPNAAAILARMTAAQNVDSTCQSNSNGASLPAGRFYITLCFQSNLIPAGGTTRLEIHQPGGTLAAPSQSARVSGSSHYQWFIFSLSKPGSYTVEVFWNGALAKVYSLTIG
jgi:serine/threonine protein kinase